MYAATVLWAAATQCVTSRRVRSHSVWTRSTCPGSAAPPALTVSQSSSSSFTALASLCPVRVTLVQGLHPEEDNCLLLWPLRGPPPLGYITLFFIV